MLSRYKHTHKHKMLRMVFSFSSNNIVIFYFSSNITTYEPIIAYTYMKLANMPYTHKNKYQFSWDYRGITFECRGYATDRPCCQRVYVYTRVNWMLFIFKLYKYSHFLCMFLPKTLDTSLLVKSQCAQFQCLGFRASIRQSIIFDLAVRLFFDLEVVELNLFVRIWYIQYLSSSSS